MRKQGINLSCHSCGRVAKCPPEALPCEVLKGWLTVSYWGGLGSVEHYNFCSFSCLESWVDAQVPRVPGVFLKSFGEDES